MSNDCLNEAWCDFCFAQNMTGNVGFTPAYRAYFDDSPPSRLIFETANFSVISGLGQLVEGYTLIVTKRHFLSMAHLPLYLYEELNYVYNLVKRAIEEKYVPPIVFEHGPMKQQIRGIDFSGGGGSCLEHAHLHFMPIPNGN